MHGIRDASIQISDARLVEMAVSGESEAFDTLVKRYQRAVYAVAFAVISEREAALDVLQESFIAAYRQMHTLDDPSHFGPWVCGIARNQAKLMRRVRNRHAFRELPLPVMEITSEKSQANALTEIIRDAIASLTETQADVVTLFYMEGYSIAECSLLLEVPQGTIKRRLHDARQRLKKEMTDMVKEHLSEFALSEDYRVVIDKPSNNFTVAPALIWFKDRWVLIWQDGTMWGEVRWQVDHMRFWICESTDGKTWSEPRLIDLPEQLQALPKLCIVGDLLVMHTHNYDAGLMVATTPDLVNWTNHPKLRVGNIARSHAFSSGDKLFVVYPLNVHCEETIRILKSKDAGASWSWINSPVTSHEFWQIDTAGLAVGDRLYIAWRDFANKGGEERYTRICWSDDGGENWSEHVTIDSLLTQPREGGMGLSLALAKDRLIVVQEKSIDDADGEIWLASSTDGGTTWSEKAVYSTGSLIGPAIAVAPDGTLMLAGSSRTADKARPWVVHSRIKD